MIDRRQKVCSASNESTRSVVSEIDRLVHEPARLIIMAHLYGVDSVDYVFLMKNTGLTWGNLSSHLNKLEDAGYIEVTKEFVDRKPHTMAGLTHKGREAFDSYRRMMRQLFESLPCP